MQSSLLPGLERLQPAAAGLLSTTVEAGGSRVFCSQAARPGIPQEEGLCLATHSRQPRLSAPSSGAAAGLGGDVTGEGQRTGLPRMSSRMPSLLLKHCQQGRMEALGRVGSKDFQAAGTWPQYDPEERNAGPGAAAAPTTLGASPLFSGAAAGVPREKIPHRCPRQCRRGRRDLGTAVSPSAEVLPSLVVRGCTVCPPCVGTKEGAPNLGRFPEEHSALCCRRHRLAGLHSRAESPVLSHCSRVTGSRSPFQDTPDDWRKTEMLPCVRRYLSRTYLWEVFLFLSALPSESSVSRDAQKPNLSQADISRQTPWLHPGWEQMLRTTLSEFNKITGSNTRCTALKCQNTFGGRNK